MNGTEQKTKQTPYSAWLQTEMLHTLQQTVSDHPGEYAFLINVQVQELYWALIVKEMQAARPVFAKTIWWRLTKPCSEWWITTNP
jgi:tryptophan 2,3-dioxygenase